MTDTTNSTADTALAYEQGADAAVDWRHNRPGEQPTSAENPYSDSSGRQRSAAARSYRAGWNSVYGHDSVYEL
jgi:hypothetical protein